MELENSANKIDNNQENQENNLNNTKEKKSLVIQKKLKVMCKYFMMGKCTKGENCKYLHNEQEKEKRINVPKLECPMYNIGYCKSGNMCNYIHKKCETLPENMSENILPIWIIEHYLEKSINLIFKELEQQNLPEIIELRKKYNLPLNSENNTINNNNNNNNNLPVLIPLKNNTNQNDNNFDKYGPKKNSIENLINSNRLIKYYLVKIDTYNDIKNSMENNKLKINEILKNKLINEISINNNLTIITIIFDNENLNYTGFAKIKKLSEINKENKELSLNIEWLWKTKLHYSKLNHLINKSDNDNFFVKGENGCNIDPNLGNYICRLMIKRLSKDEVKELVQEKKIFENQMISLIENNNYINKINKQINILNDNLKNTKAVKDFFLNNINNSNKNNNNNKINNNIKNKNEINKNMKFEGKKRKRKKSSESISKSSSLHTYDTHESSNHKKSYDYDYYDKNSAKKNYFEKNNKTYHHFNNNDKYNNGKDKFRNKYKKYKNNFIK